MADDNQELRIHIVSDADTAGFKSAAASATELEKQMGVVSVSGADVEKALGKTEEKAELSSRAMRRLAASLGSDVPGGASALEAAFASMEGEEGSVMGATFLLVAGLEVLKYSIQKVSAQKEEARRITDELNDADAAQTKVIDDERKALDAAEISEAEFHHNFVRNANAAIDKALELAGAIAKASAATGQKNDDQNKGIAGKEIDEMEKRGVISHAAALKMKEQLDIEYEQAKVARMMATDAIEQGLLINQLNNKQLKLHEEQETQEPAAAAAAQAAAKVKAENDGKIEDAQKKIAAGEQVKKELRATGVTEDSVEKLKELYQNVMGGDPEKTPLEDQFHALANVSRFRNAQMIYMFGTSGDQNLANYEGANLDIAGGKRDLKAAQGKSVAVDSDAANAKSDLDAMHTDMQKNKADIAALQSQIESKKATNAINEGGAMLDLNTQNATSDLQGDQATADAVAGGKQFSAADAQKMMADASKIAGHQVDLQTAAQIIENGANNIGIFMNQVTRLAGVLGKMSPAEVQKLQRQVDQIEAQLRQTPHLGQ